MEEMEEMEETEEEGVRELSGEVRSSSFVQ